MLALRMPKWELWDETSPMPWLSCVMRFFFDQLTSVWLVKYLNMKPPHTLPATPITAHSGTICAGGSRGAQLPGRGGPSPSLPPTPPPQRDDGLRRTAGLYQNSLMVLPFGISGNPLAACSHLTHAKRYP